MRSHGIRAVPTRTGWLEHQLAGYTHWLNQRAGVGWLVWNCWLLRNDKNSVGPVSPVTGMNLARVPCDDRCVLKQIHQRRFLRMDELLASSDAIERGGPGRELCIWGRGACQGLSIPNPSCGWRASAGVRVCGGAGAGVGAGAGAGAGARWVAGAAAGAADPSALFASRSMFICARRLVVNVEHVDPVR